MTIDSKMAALEAVKKAQERWERERQEADGRRRTAVNEALREGLTMTDIGRSMGLSRERVAQIRDGRSK